MLGTFVTISVYGENRERVNAAVSAAFEEFRRIDSLMSIHRADSELSQVNARASVEPVVLSGDLWRVIAKAQDIAEQTEGSFDITIRPLADLWGFIWKEYRLPTDAQLKAVLTTDGPLLITAGAGTGKTRTLVYRVARLVETGARPESVLLLTFTRRAATSMLARAASLAV